jgi:hypothetical protein
VDRTFAEGGLQFDADGLVDTSVVVGTGISAITGDPSWHTG